MNPRQEIRLLVCAAQFMTRLPLPRLRGFQPDWIGRSARYFPLVGQGTGLVAALVWLGAGRVWSGPVAAILAIAAGALVTGALHEDGLADAVDGLAGGQTREQRLAIMKDSRIGTFGALALGLVTALRVAALAACPAWTGAVALVAAHGAGRAAAAVAMAGLPYAGEAATAKAGASPQAVSAANALTAALLGLWPVLLLDWRRGVVGLALGGGVALALALAARRMVGGRTGDVLGGIEQLMEAGVLLGAAAAFA